jgi:hypothetical protein
MKTHVHLTNLNDVSELEIFQTDVIRENQNTYLMFSISFFLENRVFYEKMKKNMIQPDRPQMTILTETVHRRWDLLVG